MSIYLEKIKHKGLIIICVIRTITYAIILKYSFYMPSPVTEGWFTTLVDDRSIRDILIAKDILLLPGYAIIIKIITSLSEELILLRFIGLLLGIVLAIALESVARITFRITSPNLSKNLTEATSPTVALLTIIYIINNSNYLLLYDFTMLVMIIQTFLLAIMLKYFSKINKRDEHRKEIYIFLSGLLVGIGVYIKHSNLGITALVYSHFYAIETIIARKYRDLIIYLLAVMSIFFLSIITLALNNINIGDGISNSLQMLNSSAEAKGGLKQIMQFIANSQSILADNALSPLGIIGVMVSSTLFATYLINSQVIRGSIANKWGKYIIIFCNISSLIAMLHIVSDKNIVFANISILSTMITFMLIIYSSMLKIMSKFSYLGIKIDWTLCELNNYTWISISWLIASATCIVGNMTSAGLGYNGLFLGVAFAWYIVLYNMTNIIISMRRDLL